jgi:hypothetical protein
MEGDGGKSQEEQNKGKKWKGTKNNHSFSLGYSLLCVVWYCLPKILLPVGL